MAALQQTLGVVESRWARAPESGRGLCGVLGGDFLRQLVNRSSSSDIGKNMTAFASLLANGERHGRHSARTPNLAGRSGRPPRVRRRGVAPHCGPHPPTLQADALRQHLLPDLFAVQAPIGVEVLPRLELAWREHTTPTTPARVLADFDQPTAHNDVDMTALMTRAAAVTPDGLRWLRWVYPLDSPSFVSYKDLVIESRSGGQQGCPWRLPSFDVACHPGGPRALPAPLRDVPMLVPELQPPPQLDALALFADAGLLAGAE